METRDRSPPLETVPWAWTPSSDQSKSVRCEKTAEHRGLVSKGWILHLRKRRVSRNKGQWGMITYLVQNCFPTTFHDLDRDTVVLGSRRLFNCEVLCATNRLGVLIDRRSNKQEKDETPDDRFLSLIHRLTLTHQALSSFEPQSFKWFKKTQLTDYTSGTWRWIEGDETAIERMKQESITYLITIG